MIGRRLSKLSAECNRLLSVAAVIGRDFRLDVLEKVAGASEETLFGSIREATGTAILEERPSAASVVLYRFSHAFFRQTLYEEMIAPQRIRLHQQVARTLEEVYAGRLEEHAVELAEHFSYYSDPAALAKAVTYGEMAARRALSVFAYQEAVGHLERCLRVQDVLDPNDKTRRCDLLLALAEALMPAGEPKRVFEEVAEEALALAEALDDQPRAARTCTIALLALNRFAISTQGVEGPARQWTERADHHAKAGTVDRVYADTSLAILRNLNTTGSRAIAERAWQLARELDDHQACFFAARPFITFPEAPKHHAHRLEVIRDLLERPRQGVNPRNLGGVLHHSAFILFGLGDRERAETLWQEVSDLAARTHDPAVLVYSLVEEVLIDYIGGKLEETVDRRAELVVRAKELGSPLMVGNTLPAAFWALLHLGKPDQAKMVLEAEESARSFFTDTRAQLQAALGIIPEAAALLARSRNDVDLAEAVGEALMSQLLAALVVGNLESATAIYPHLLPSRGLAQEYYSSPISPGRLLGDAARLLGHPDDAREHYEEALAVCAKVRFRPEVALLHLAFAELLNEHFPTDTAQAREHLDFALKEFEAMKMKPSLERVRQLQARLGS